ncbi:Catechol o-methyltransferase, partial [Globisporangium splendens]
MRGHAFNARIPHFAADDKATEMASTFPHPSERPPNFAEDRATQCLAFVREHAIRGDAQSVIATIDKFAYENWMMNVGDVKGAVVEAEIVKAKPKIMAEIGGYTGYSAVRFANKLREVGGADAHYYSFEFSPLFAEIATEVIGIAGLSEYVTIFVGPFSETYPKLQENGIDHVDGSVLVADNVITPGAPDYLEYIRGNPNYTSVFQDSFLEYSNEKDGLEINDAARRGGVADAGRDSAQQQTSLWGSVIHSVRNIEKTKVTPQAQGPRLASSRRHSALNSRECSHGQARVHVRKGKRLAFYQAFGLLGPPLVIVVCVSAVWTAGLAVLNFAPNKTANFLMKTAEFDDGAFWLIIDQKPVLRGLTFCSLGAIFLGYCHVLLRTTLLRNQTFAISNNLFKIPRVLSAEHQSSQRALTTWEKLTGFEGVYRKFWNTWLKIIDFGMQSITLHQILEAGFPVPLVCTYAAFIAANSLSCVIAILNPSKLSAFSGVLIDTMFDMMMAIGAPIILLLYSYHYSQFDREMFLINLEMAQVGSFERQARLFANPTEVTLFLRCFNGLRIANGLDLCVRLGMNMGFCYRLTRVVEVKIAQKAVPSWVKNWNFSNLAVMPADLFSQMSTLTFLHLGEHHVLQDLPSFDGLSNLQSMTLAVLTSLKELPSFESLRNLERLELLTLSNVTYLPSFAPLQKLSYLVVQAFPVCYNGVLGTCDTSKGVACPEDSSAVDEIDDESERILDQFSSAICAGQSGSGATAGVTDNATSSASTSNKTLQGPTKEEVDICGGVLYRQCNITTTSGITDSVMCYNDHMRAISCINRPTSIEIRKMQILRHAGLPCDPVEEKWLGCPSE